MNISKHEQRVLHLLAQGGAIHFVRLANGKLATAQCFTRDGHHYLGCSLELVDRLKKRRFIRSCKGQPYRVTKLGIQCVRAQLDNR